MKIHVLGLPHTQTRKEEFSTCAFTQKVIKLCAMMHRRGHEVIHYGVEGSNPECSKNVPIALKHDWEKAYPHPGSEFYKHDKPNAEYLAKWTARLADKLKEHCSSEKNTEIIAMTWGGEQRAAVTAALAAGATEQFQVETGIGYRYSWAEYRVYESYAWMHMHLGAGGNFDGSKWYWSVIPNAFDLDDFLPADEASEEREGKYFLYIGRLNADKGVGWAVDVTKRIGAQLLIVGQGDPKPFLDGNPHVTYLPPVGPVERAALMHGARAVLCPTFYVEPFGGVAVEAQLCGTPVITTDWGVFNETVVHGKTGYRCRTMEQFEWAAKHGVEDISRADCRKWAEENYSLGRVAQMYEEYFGQVLAVRGKGLYAPNPGRQHLDWLDRVEVSEPPFVEEQWADVVPPDATPENVWVQAQKWERDWWGLSWSPRWDEEIKKQNTYFDKMIGGVPTKIRNFGENTILDVGCGPVSMLQRSIHGPSRGVDPLAVSDETLARYAACRVEFLNVKAEEMPVDRYFDEVWCYNCLQHTDNPKEILRRMALLCAQGGVIRLFEWRDLPPCPGHPQTLTEAMFVEAFPNALWERLTWDVGQLGDIDGNVENKYIAFSIRKI